LVIHFFIRTIYKNTRLIFAQKFKNILRTIPALAEEQCLKFSI